MIVSEYLNFKIYLLKDILLIGAKKYLLLVKINDTVPYTYNLKDLNDEEIIGSFYDRELRKSIL